LAKTKTPPLYQIIFDDLYEKIQKGVYKTGDKIPTEKELMVQYGTSRITASRAVIELEKKNYVRRLKAAGSFVTPQNMWEENNKNPMKNIQPSVAVIIPSSTSNIYIEMEVLQGIGISCRNLGFSLNLYTNDSDETTMKSPYDFEKQLISELIEKGFVGAIIFPSSSNESPEIYNLMIRKNFPFVLLDRKVFGVEAPLVSSDNKNGFYSIVQYVISKGHKRIAFVSGNTHESSSRVERFYGYIKAMNDYKMEVEEQFIIHKLFPENLNHQYYSDLESKTLYNQNAIKAMLEQFFSYENPPTAIVATNDYIALNIMSVAGSLGYKIPEDISIAGFDQLSIGELITPQIATVAQDYLIMGQESVKLLDQIIHNPHKKVHDVVIPTTLIPGRSIKEF
jgi:DNA-binding LacI/PurR family transcriptional regulator